MRTTALSTVIVILMTAPATWGQTDREPAVGSEPTEATEPEPPEGAGAEAEAGAVEAETTEAAAPEALANEAPAAAPELAPESPPAPESEPAPEPEVARGAATSDVDADTLIASLAQDDASTSTAVEERPLQVYGFADVGFRQAFVEKHSPWLIFLNRHPSFFVGNANVYFDKQLHDKWRAMLEVRFTSLPNGARQIGIDDDEINRENNRESDHTNFQRDSAIGGIIPQQIWVDYAPVPLLKLRVGQWLSPYGIWNVDHGSPVIIGVNRPFIIGSQLIPEYQIGVLATGGSLLAGPVEWSYAFGLSNGRTHLTALEDLDSNKAVTGRLALSVSGASTLDVGASAYLGRHTESYEGIGAGADGIETDERIWEQYDELTYAFDLKWQYEGLLLQSEWLVYQRRFTDEGRRGAAAGGLLPDRLKWGGYGLLGYRLPWLPLMPYFKAETSPENTAEQLGIPDQVALLTPGLNYRPIHRVVLKAEYNHAFFTETKGDTTGFSRAPLNMLDFQVAWAF